MAWLNATPRPPEGSKRAKAKDLPPAISRAQKLKNDKIKPVMPPVSAQHILSRLIEIGLVERTDKGSAPISWQSIKAWQNVVGAHLPRWEARLIRKLSVEYLAFGHDAESENCPSPWRAPITEREKKLEVSRLEMVLG